MSFPRLSTLPPDVIAVAVALLLLSGVFLIRRLWLRLLGPVFVYEADRVARRGRTSVVRVVYVLVLLGILFLSHPRVEVMTLDPNSDPRVVYPQSVQQVLSRFAAEFSHAFLIAQAVVVLLLTPIYVG